LNTYTLADGRFFDFEEFGANGLAVIDVRNKLFLAERGNVVAADRPAGSVLHATPPYIYTSAPVLPGESDALLKFSYKDGLLRWEKSQNIDGNIFNVAITDLNRDQKPEMLVTVQNQRGIFIEVHEPF
jgi:hypothetical protein